MKILFVNLGDTMQEILGFLYVSAMLKKHGHSVELSLVSQSRPLDIAKSFQPDIIAYSTTTGLHNQYLTINQALKKEIPFFSVFGGPHPTFFPEMIEEEGVDALCIGEGENAFVELVDSIENQQEYRFVRNFWIKEKGTIYKNEVRPLIDNLDEFPFPDRELLYNKDAFLRNSPVKSLITRRGCPYSCSYCFNHHYHRMYKNKGKVVRYRSVDNVIAELQEIRDNYPVEMFGFVDDNFILSKKWLQEFSEKYAVRFDVPFYCGVHVDQIDEERCALLKKAGCQAVYMGIESGDETLRKQLLRRNISEEQIRRSASTIKMFGMKLFAQNMLGFPGGSFKTAMRTVFLNMDCQPDFSWVSLYAPFPRTDLGDYAVRHGFFTGAPESIAPTYHGTSLLNFSSKQEKQQIERMHHLFDMMVKFPGLLPFFLLLTRMPIDRVALFVYKFWFGLTVRRRVFQYKLTFSGFVATVWRYFHNTHMPSSSRKETPEKPVIRG